MIKFKELLFLKELNGVGPVRINKFYLPLLRNGMNLEDLKDAAVKYENKVNAESASLSCRKAETVYNEIAGRKDIQIYTIFDDDYPENLKSLGNKAPVILYAKGNIKSAGKKSIAVVGTREPSTWSIKVERQLIGKILELADRSIVSGLALGCDTIAHKTCLENKGVTVAVLPCGFDCISPAENTGLSEDIIKNDGVLLSEYSPGTQAAPYTFVERDALIAAVSDAVFVMECKKKSGTMHTVNAAFDIGKPVGVFQTTASGQGNYDGNDYIISERNGIAVTDSKTLTAFLNSIEKQNAESVPSQLCLFDFMGK